MQVMHVRQLVLLSTNMLCKYYVVDTRTQWWAEVWKGTIILNKDTRSGSAGLGFRLYL